MTPGAIMFLLDAALTLPLWLLTMAFTLPKRFGLFHATTSGVEAALLFPAMHLLLLYALGLYRRDTILDVRKAMARLPISVTLAGLTAVAIGKLLARLMTDWPEPADGTLLFSTSVLCLGTCAFAARLAFLALRRQRLMRTPLLVVGAGARAWDLIWNSLAC